MYLNDPSSPLSIFNSFTFPSTTLCIISAQRLPVSPSASYSFSWFLFPKLKIAVLLILTLWFSSLEHKLPKGSLLFATEFPGSIEIPGQSQSSVTFYWMNYFSALWLHGPLLILTVPRSVIEQMNTTIQLCFAVFPYSFYKLWSPRIIFAPQRCDQEKNSMKVKRYCEELYC